MSTINHLAHVGLMEDWGRGLLVAGFAGASKARTRRPAPERPSLAARLKRLLASLF